MRHRLTTSSFIVIPFLMTAWVSEWVCTCVWVCMWINRFGFYPAPTNGPSPNTLRVSDLYSSLSLSPPLTPATNRKDVDCLPFASLHQKLSLLSSWRWVVACVSPKGESWVVSLSFSFCTCLSTNCNHHHLLLLSLFWLQGYTVRT